MCYLFFYFLMNSWIYINNISKFYPSLLWKPQTLLGKKDIILSFFLVLPRTLYFHGVEINKIRISYTFQLRIPFISRLHGVEIRNYYSKRPYSLFLYLKNMPRSKEARHPACFPITIISIYNQNSALRPISF